MAERGGRYERHHEQQTRWLLEGLEIERKKAQLHARKKIFGRLSEAAPVSVQTNLFAQEELISGLIESRNEIVVTEPNARRVSRGYART